MNSLNIGTVFEQLTTRLGATAVLQGDAISARYARDWSGDYQMAPLAVLRPDTVDGVVAAINACREAGLPLIPQGGHTGLVGGATADAPGQVILTLERMNRIRALDPVGMSITVEAGCVLEAVKAAAAAQDCLFPLSLGAQGSCVIGGNLSTNAGGINVLRYGMMRDLTFGLEVVMADGRVLSDLRALRKNNTGYDLKQLFIGGEGTLGVITAATLKLFPQPRWIETLWLSVDTVEEVMALFARFRNEGGELLSAFELIPAECVELACDVQPDLRQPELTGHRMHALIELSASGGPDLHGWLSAFVEDLFEKGLAKNGILTQNQSQARRLWRIREVMNDAQQRQGLHLRTDVSVPIAAIAPFIAEVTKAILDALPGATVLPYGHVGDGNVHVNVLRPAGMAEETFRPMLLPLTALINQTIDRFGGSISAEHGIGRAKRQPLADRMDAPHRDVIRGLKQLMDPTGMLAPGRILV